jgi:hypothetical protein
MGKLRCFEPGIFALACCVLAASAGAEGAHSGHRLGLGGKGRVLAGHLLDYRAATIKPMLMTSRIRGGGGQQRKQHRRAAGDKWQRRIMVTGGCGFVGSVLVDRLSRNYPEYLIVVLDRLDDCASEQSIAQPLSRTNCILVKGDVKPPSLTLPPPWPCESVAAAILSNLPRLILIPFAFSLCYMIHRL